MSGKRRPRGAIVAVVALLGAPVRDELWVAEFGDDTVSAYRLAG